MTARRGSRLRPAVLLLLLAFASVVAMPGVASAHAELLSTTPTNGAVLARSPAVVDLLFGEEVEARLGSVQVIDASRHRVDDGNTHHPGGRGSVVEASLKPDL